MTEAGLTKQRIFAELTKSSHGALKEYVPVATQAVTQEAEFYQHLIAWNFKHGQIRDSKVALPVIGLAHEKDPELVDNALAHIALLGPRELSRAYRFSLEIRLAGRTRQLRRVVESYLHQKEDEKGWDHFALQHRNTLRELYALAHVKPQKERTNIVLYGRRYDKSKAPLPKGSVFEAVANLRNMSATEAASVIMTRKIPFLIAMGALGAKAKEPDLVLALIDRMTASELVTSTKMLDKLGVKTNPALRGAFDKAMERAATSKKNTLKTTAAIEAVDDEKLKEKLRGVQKKQIAAAGGPEGDWLVLADKSGSMSQAIELARHVSASLATFVKGKVHLVFFDTSPLYVDVSGLSLDQIKAATRHVGANGGTSVGVGLNRMLAEKIEVDGIVVVSDGGENNPPYFHDVYPKYTQLVGKDVPVYFYQTAGDRDAFSGFLKRAGIELQTFDLRQSRIDYYSIPNLVQTMRSNPYSMVDEIMATPLLSLSEVLRNAGELVGA